MTGADAPPRTAFNRAERRTIDRLRTPVAVQRFLNALPYNTEPAPGGATCAAFAACCVMAAAHCLEAALAAAVILEQHGFPPLVLSFESIDELDHVLFVYRETGAGAQLRARAIQACTAASRCSRQRGRWRSVTSTRTWISPVA